MARTKRSKTHTDHPNAFAGIYVTYTDNPPASVALVRDILGMAKALDRLDQGMSEEVHRARMATVGFVLTYIRHRFDGAKSTSPAEVMDWAYEYAKRTE